MARVIAFVLAGVLAGTALAGCGPDATQDGVNITTSGTTGTVGNPDPTVEDPSTTPENPGTTEPTDPPIEEPVVVNCDDWAPLTGEWWAKGWGGSITIGQFGIDEETHICKTTVQEGPTWFMKIWGIPDSTTACGPHPNDEKYCYAYSAEDDTLTTYGTGHDGSSIAKRVQ